MNTTRGSRCGSSFTNAATMVALAIASTVGPDALGQSWINPATGDWFTAGNWLPATVPVAGGAVVVSNGGTAQLSGVPSTPLLGGLSVGIGGTGTGTGTVQSNGVAILTTGGFSIGAATGNAAPFVANGSLTITGAGAQGNSATVGSIFTTTAAGTATGTMSIAGSLPIANGFISVGQTLGAFRGSIANGSLLIGGDAGTTVFTTVGAAFPAIASEVGTRATGALAIGGNLGMVGGGAMNIGATFNPPVATFFDQVHGTATIGGALTFTGPVSLAVGVSGGGVAHGELHVDSIVTTAGTATFSGIGTAFQGGSAFGRMTATSGDLRTSGTLGIGTATGAPGVGASADGLLSLGGQLSCVAGCGGLNIGSTSGSGLVTSVGSATTNGLSGFTGYSVGLLSGSGLTAGSSALGTLVSTGTGSAGAPGGATVGSIFTTTAAGTATGTMSVAGSLPIANGFISVGQTLGAARGSIANGSLIIGGDAGTTVFTTVGAAFPATASEVGTRATGALAIGGNLGMVGGGAMNIGATFNPPVATFFDQVHGTATIGGALTFTGPVSVAVGVSGGGVAHGELHVGSIVTTAGTASFSGIGTAFQGGSAFGRMTATSGDLRTGGSLGIGTATAAPGIGASADGLLSLGGQLSCVTGCGGLNVGTAGGSSLATARGHATATGFSGFSGYGVGVLNNASTAASFADGTLIAGAGGVNSTGFTALTVGAAFTAATGTSATGLVRVNGGNIGAFAFVSIGMGIEGAGTHTGTVELNGGTLGGLQLLSVGALFNTNAPTAIADGTLSVTNGQILNTTMFGPGSASIGFASGNGSATGRLIATDSTVTLEFVGLGVNSGAEGSANGIMQLTGSTLNAESIFAGSGTAATATMILSDSTLNVAAGLSLTNGLLRLDNSFADIGGAFSLGDGATLAIDVDGLLRGLDYGAIDAFAAFLDGVLTLSFEDLVPFGNLMAFDLIVSSSATGIAGDFDSVGFTGVPGGYSLFAGTVLEGVEIYRVRLVRNEVAEPATLLLLPMALGLMFASRRRAQTRSTRARATCPT